MKTIDLGERGIVEIVADGDALAQAAAEILIETSETAERENRQALVALSGGSTPKKMGELLSTPEYASRVQWKSLQFFWGDERWVPLSDGESNAGEAMRAFLDESPVSNDQVHPWDTDDGLSPEEAAAKYEKRIRKYSGTKDGGEPEFDLIFLGMGEDGHTLSLFPGTPAVRNTTDLTIAHHVPKLDAQRVTFGQALANAARKVVFLVGGAGKADMLPRVLEGPIDLDVTPSQVIRPTNGELLWIVDEAAAAHLQDA